MSYIVLKPFLYFVQGDIIEEATDETKSADYTLLPNEIKIALELGGVLENTAKRTFLFRGGGEIVEIIERYEPQENKEENK